MCGELLHGQNALVHCICQRLDTTDLNNAVQENVAVLQQYRTELDQYYQAACQLYEQIATVRANIEEPVPAASQQDQEEVLSERRETEEHGAAGEDVGGANRGGTSEQEPELERPHRPEPPSVASLYPPPIFPGPFSYPYSYSPRSRNSLVDPSPAMYGPPAGLNTSYQTPPATVDAVDNSGAYGQRVERPSSPAQANVMPPPPPPPFSAMMGIPPNQPYYHPYPHSALFHSPARGELAISAQPSPYQSRQTSYLSPQQWYYPRRHSSLSAMPPYPPPTHSPYQLGPTYGGGLRVTVSSEGERYTTLRSPSGITAASTQVQPPSSPHSASENNLNSAQAPPTAGPTPSDPSAHQGEESANAMAAPTQPAASSLAQKSHKAAMAELKQNIATSGASALGLAPSAGKGEETESVSSLPLSVPEGSSG